ncbi:MAG: tRNA pseudouridine(13) synthase TruD [Myxococcota bacterium]
MDPLAPLPRVTRGLTGTGGIIKESPDDFEVEELPAYDPCGEGEHLYLWIEKRGVSADALIRRVARALEIPSKEIGCAGLKDRRAVTRQHLSVPASAEAQVAAIDGEGVRVLRAMRHRNKLKTGHLDGNRFRAVIRGGDEGASARAAAIVERLRQTGVPNFYGSQRFGRDGDTVAMGIDLLHGRRSPALSRAPRGRRRFLKRLALSSVQSAVFNRCLAARMEDGLLDRVIPGDVMQVCASGGLFVADDTEREQARFDARDIVPAGPMFGPKMHRARGDAAARESAALSELELREDLFDGHGKVMTGTRRANLVWPGELTVGGTDDVIELCFTLPAGSYATVLLGEVTGCLF